MRTVSRAPVPMRTDEPRGGPLMEEGTNPSAVAIDALSKTYPGGIKAVRAISFEVAAGEVFGLLGPNGAGKSTTVGMLTTTIVPTSGSASLAGFDVVRAPLSARAVSSVVFQEAVVDGGLSGRRHLEIHARLWRVDEREAKARIAELEQTLGLEEVIRRPVSSYSGGQRRRLEIARALVSNPRVLFLDEPTVGLDPRIRAELIDVLSTLRDRRGTTILLTTHYLDEAERLCDRLAIMHRGEIVALDGPRALRAQLAEQIVELRPRDDARVALERLQAERIAGSDAFIVGTTITVPLHDRGAADAVGAIESAGVAVTAISTREPTLDDVYLRLTGGELRAA
jgi:ABC-2 type transport system ATP-binding protein